MSLHGHKSEPSVLVVGAGMAGIVAAHHVAEWGAHVYLADRAPHLGGAFLLLDHTYTTDSCGLCIALPRQPSYCPTIASELHPRITPLPRTTLVALEGEPGDFVARVRYAPRCVDPDRCDHCGACARVCPVQRPLSRWGRTLHEPGQRAIYPPPLRAVPFAYAIDPELCTRCGACVDACPREAIDLDAASSEGQVEVDAVVLSPGFVPFDAARALEYGWGRCADVVTSLEFERMLNRSGPTRGRPLRPSDGRLPRRVAYIHCVGSRSERLGRPYCSTSCCMIAAKQVRLAKEVASEMEVTLFTMDVRAAGKGYERYLGQVATLPGVTYRWGRPAAVHEIPRTGSGHTSQEGNLRLLTPEGEEVFDLVVLAVGMGPDSDPASGGVRQLAACAGVALDEHGFILPGAEGPGSTSRRGVFAAGAALAPADVPTTVTQAEAAAALAAGVLPSIVSPAPSPRHQGRMGGNPSAADWSSSAAEEWLDQPPRIGVFLCTCQGTMEGTLDYGALAAWGERLRGVDHVEQVGAACEEEGLCAMERAVVEHGLNRILVLGCAPRLYADRFDALMARLRLPPRLLARVDIRQGPAFPAAYGGTADGGATVAQGELAMAVAGLREAPYTLFSIRPQENVARRVLVLGGGMAGMTAALTLAALGVACDLVERAPQLGGHVRDMPHALEGGAHSLLLDLQALLLETTARLRRAEGVRLWTEAELAGWSGVRGDFAAEIRLGNGQDGRVIRERYGALILATGAEPATTGEYLHGTHPRVITQRELERLLSADATSCVDGLGSHVVMIQCVGSRDETHPYCSQVCCTQAVQNALLLKERDPSAEVSVLFRDIRTMGVDELLYLEARRLGVRFLRYEPPERPLVEVAGDQLSVTVHDRLYDQTVRLDADLLVLSTGIVPHVAGNRRLADLLGVSLDEDGFFAEVHPKLRPTDLERPGLYLCGMAYGPGTVAESIAQARAAAFRAALAVARPAEPRRDIAAVVQKLCSACGLCVAHCPYGARVMQEGVPGESARFAHVIDHLCQGCGACVAVCPNGASRQPALEPVQMLALVDAALIE